MGFCGVCSIYCIYHQLVGLCGIYHMTALKSLERDGIDTLHSLPVSHALRMCLEQRVAS